ncbi:sulfur oxidation c-type cytochrome SoxA [Azonexus sp.]|uniref:sulfur oxidation c-type cytochrome SoxA n=1 Tax=Azonexus sp. TaxID=1872668 RepID=UPI0027B9A69D|nr:sulfur oxidation c-type cytochrome SoxA [Azonexus sp.]
MLAPKKYTVFVLAALLAGPAFSASASDKLLDGINEYREALADGNPSELAAAEGEELWKTKRGPKNSSLERCDLGLGPGVIKGASAQLPRFFKDTGKVQDLETRLMTCMETLQGLDPQAVVKAGWLKGEKEKVAALVAYVVTESNGHKIKIDMRPPEMKKMYEMGKLAFYHRAGPMDFSCATCHGEQGKRIRMQELPDLRTQEGAAAGWGSWPAYRVSAGQFWTMQHRLNDCYRQQRAAEPIYGADVTIALSVYLAATANGGKVVTPGIKR